MISRRAERIIMLLVISLCLATPIVAAVEMKDDGPGIHIPSFDSADSDEEDLR